VERGDMVDRQPSARRKEGATKLYIDTEVATEQRDVLPIDAIEMGAK